MPEAVALEDIRDVHQFAAWIVTRKMPKEAWLRPDDVQEAIAEAVALIYEIHAEWDPDLCKGNKNFSAHLLARLPRRMIDYYRRDLWQSSRGGYDGSTHTYVKRGTVSLSAPDEGEIPHPALVTHDAHA